MKSKRIVTLLIGLMAIIVTGCQNMPALPGGPTQTAAPTETATPLAEETYAPVIDPANFVKVINNPYFLLKPGTTFIYEGKTEKGKEHHEVAVSTKKKVIMGVTCKVVKDTVKVDGKLAKVTLGWYAQDKEGNVWYFGEDSKEYKGKKVISTEGSWQAGMNGALPGIIMKANPTVGANYRQEYSKGVAEDMAEISSLSETASVLKHSYKDVLMIKEWSALDNPPVIEYKYYVKGVGLALVKGETTGELKLIKITHK